MSHSILSRASLNSSPLSATQSQVDGLVGGFVTHATDWRTLAAMSVGGGAYRLGRIGVLGSGVASASPVLARAGSLAVGLGSEVLAFEGTHRSLLRATGDSNNPNLFRWEGSGGLRQGLLNSTITFGALRGAGALAEGQNIVARHLLMDTAMVAGHNVTGRLGISDMPQGSLAEQFLHAEATTVQMEAGFALVHRLAPGLPALERGLDLAIQSGRSSFIESLAGQSPAGLQHAFATAGGPRAEGRPERSPLLDHVLMMVKGERGDEAPASSQRPIEGSPEGPSSGSRQSPAEILRDLGRILEQVGEGVEEGKPASDRTRNQLHELGRLAQEHPEVLNEIASLVDTIRRYPSIAESLEPVLRTLNQEGRSTKGALGAAQRELKRVIDENPELRRQAENFLRLKHLIPNSMTLAAGLMAIVSSVYSLRGEPTTACVLLAVAAVIDKMDGTVARLLRAQHPIGERFDSYADFANYGLASALFTYGVLNHHGEGLLGWGVGLTIGAMAMLRLATFDYLESNPHALPARDILRNPILGHGKDFIGMPSTMMGLLLPAYYWAFGTSHPNIFYGLAALSGIAMYSPLRYGKLTDGIMGGIGRRVIQTIRNPVKLAVGGATAGILAYLGYRFPEFSLPLLKVGVVGGLGTYVGSPFIEAFSRFFASGNGNGNNTPSPPPVLLPPKIDEGMLPSQPPKADESVSGRTPIPGERNP